jgi:esterase/lipase superfamily enzyme
MRPSPLGGELTTSDRMANSSPLSPDQDIFVDANVFFAIGAPSNAKYQAFRREVTRADVVLKLPRRVVGELGGRKAEPVRTALEDGWVEVVDAPPIRDADAVTASDIARRTMAETTGRPEHQIEKTDTILAGLAIQYLRDTENRSVVVITDDVPAKRGIETAVQAQGYEDSVTVLSRFDVIGDDPGSMRVL